MKTLTIIDTFGFFFRNYYALPQLKSRSGFPTGLLTGFINFISNIEKEHGTDYMLFALDSKKESIRKEIDPNYKANRPPAPEDLLAQLPVAIEWINKMGFKSIEIEGYEADDVIASMVKFAKDNDIKVKIVSHDKDLYQLIDDGLVVIYDPIKKVEIDESGCKEKYGVEPKKIRDYLSIVGDSADNIPGVKGIGQKGALKLFEEFEDIGQIYENLDKIENKRTNNLLNQSKQNAFLSYKLVKLYDDLMQKCDMDEFKFPDSDPILKIKDSLLKFDIKSVLNKFEIKLDKKEDLNENTFKAILLDTKEKLFNAVDNIAQESIIAFDTETDSLDARTANIVGFSFSANEKEAYYVPITHQYLGVPNQVSKEVAKEALEKLFKHKIVGQNLKYDLAIIYNNFGFSRIDPYADTMIISWLLDPGLSAGLDNMAMRYFGYKMVKFKDVVKKGENFSHVDIEDACKYASEDAWMTLKLYSKMSHYLTEELQDEAKKVEYPFVNTLLNMEDEGIKIDVGFFSELLCEADKKMSELTKAIYSLSSSEFNINSTKQLGSILFEKLNLKVIKKTKTGYSTDEKVLNELINDHPVIEKILDYREIHKLRSTYIEPLLNLAKKNSDNRIFTSFLQTGTATGRLSSKNPNLQNIPVKSETGRKIREGFVAKDGYKLVGIDYSQIELRLLAHFSGDEALTNAFIENKDIHYETALKIFGSEMAKEKRGVAKAVNFGLLYGMGSRRLSQTINVSQTEAKEYIQSYFNSFPTVKSFISSVQEKAKNEGFVETLLKRRRYFDFGNATAMAQAGFLREAPNTVFQGSAADLIKMAMNEIDQELDKNDGKMLLQIHDELIFEVKAEKADQYAKKAQEIMQNIHILRVPLKCALSIGDNWGELK